MNTQKIKYREWIPSSPLLRAGASLFVAVLFWWMLVNGVQSVSGTVAAFYPSVAFIFLFTVFGFGIMSLFPGVSIRISHQWMVDGTHQPILKIRGMGKTGGFNIPCRNIREVEIAAYEVPLWHALRGPFDTTTIDDRFTVKLAGFRGAGLNITFTYETPFSDRPKTRKILFPTRRSEQLLNLLLTISSSGEAKRNEQIDSSVDNSAEHERKG